MHYSLLLLVVAGYISTVRADRGTASDITPTVCNAAPTQTADLISAPTCYHAADPHGSMGLCPDLSSKGWCDCGSAGDFPVLSGNNICGYTSLDPLATLALTTTNCATSTSTKISTLTVVPIAATGTAAAKREEFGPVVTAVPHRANRRTSVLSKRDGKVTYSNCDGAPPTGSKYSKDNGFPSMQSVLKQAYADARTLASKAQNVAADNKGFTHYFGGAHPDVQLDHFKKMMAAIASSDTNYSIQFECKNTPDCKPTSVMVTDATAGSATDVKTIQVCSNFWTADTSKYLLYDSTKTAPSPPYRNNDASGWCRKSTNKNNGDNNVSARQQQFFATAGHTVLHELTHLDSLAKVAGLTAPANSRHGTEDAQIGCELAGARGFLSSYIAGTSGGTSPDYNAESYSAAATEVYFMDLCGFTEIRPLDKP